MTKEEIRRSWEDYKGPPLKKEKSEASESSAPAEQPEAPAKAEAAKNAPTKVEADKSKAKPKYSAGQWVGDQVLDPERIPNGYKCENGRITRQSRKETGRPEGIGLRFGP